VLTVHTDRQTVSQSVSHLGRKIVLIKTSHAPTKITDAVLAVQTTFWNRCSPNSAHSCWLLVVGRSFYFFLDSINDWQQGGEW